MRSLGRNGAFFAPKTMFWVALMLVFAQVTHAFDACVAHIESARENTTVVRVPCAAGHHCDLCAPAPPKDICESVSELAIAVSAGEHLIAPPIVILDAPFVSSPVPALENSAIAVHSRYRSDVPPLRSQFLAPQLSGRAPPFSV